MLMVVSAKVQSGRLKEHLVPSLWARNAFEMIDANFYIYHIPAIICQLPSDDLPIFGSKAMPRGPAVGFAAWAESLGGPA